MFYAIPVLLVVGLIYLIYSRTGNHPPRYKMSEPWTHAPILWSATDEVVPGGGHTGHGRHEDVVNVGGGVSGRW